MGGGALQGMRTFATFSFLLVVLASTPAFGDEVAVTKVTISTPAAVQAQDTLQVTSETTFTQTSGKTIKKATRKETSAIKVVKVNKAGGITRARVTAGKTETTGRLAATVFAADRTEAFEFKLHFDARTRAQIDEFCDWWPEDDLTLDKDRQTLFVPITALGDRGDVGWLASQVQHHAWLIRGVPLRAATAGQTFRAGAVAKLGGQDIEIVYSGLTPDDWSGVSGGTMVFQKIDGQLASYALNAHVAIALVDGTRVRGDLTGTLTIDTATAMATSLVLAGDLTGEGGVKLHLVQRVSSVLVNNENLPE